MNESLVSSVSTSTSLSYKVFTINDKEEWNGYVSRAYMSDFYHTCDYHKMDKQGEAFLFIYEVENNFIAIPLLKREIEGTEYFDCTSVYGYTGPLSNVPFADLSNAFSDNFLTSLLTYLDSQKIVSIFCVLHPFSDQEFLLKRTDSVVKVGQTVAIELRQSIEEQQLQYRRPIRLKISQLRRKGFEVRVADTLMQLHSFADIYRENMIKVGAAARYLFDDKYFEEFMNSKDFKTELLLAYFEGEIAAGAIVVLTNNIMQLHLAGTSNNFLKESPMKLIFDEACLLGRAREMHLLHLGSGVGGKEDSLFHFKSGFSKNLFDFTIWRYVCNQEVYNKLVKTKLPQGEIPNTDMFPLYRFV